MRRDLSWIIVTGVLVSASVVAVVTTPVTIKPAASHVVVAARINNQEIPMSQVEAIAMRKAGSASLDQLIGNLLVEQEAKKRGLVPKPSEIVVQIDSFKEQIKPQTIEDFYKQRHIDMDDLIDQMRIKLELYPQLSPFLKPVKTAHIRSILINIRPEGPKRPDDNTMHSESEAKAILAKVQNGLKAGKRFEDLAMQYSDDHGNKEQGGDLGVVSQISFSAASPAANAFLEQPLFKKAVFSLKQDGIAVVKSVYGYHVIKAVSTGNNPLPADKALYAAMENKIKDHQISTEAPKYVKRLRDKADVKIYLGVDIPGPAGVAAIVNGHQILVADVAKAGLRTAGASIVNELIVNTLVDQEAKKQNVTVSQEEIDAGIDDMWNKMKPGMLEESLKQHMSIDDLRTIQRVSLEVEKIIEKTIPPFKMAHISHILVTTIRPGAAPGEKQHPDSEAVEIIAQIQKELKAGKSFEELAKQYSEDLDSRDRGGDLGVITGKTRLDPEFVNAALSLKNDEVTTKPVKTSFGYHLIKAVSTGDNPLPGEQSMYAAIVKQTKMLEVEAQTHGYISALKARSKIYNSFEQ